MLDDLLGVNQSRAIGFWLESLTQVLRERRNLVVPSPDGQVYLASVLAHFSIEPSDRQLVLSENYKPGAQEFRQFADLVQVAEFILFGGIYKATPVWAESAGAHILLYAGYFARQNRHRHNLSAFAEVGKNCYRMAAVGKREKVCSEVAEAFPSHMAAFSALQRHLYEKRYLL